MRTYPSDFPCPLIDQYSIMVMGGAIRSDSPVHNTSRRVFNTVPHTFTVGFTVDPFMFTRWYDWIRSFGYQWCEINLPSMYAGKTGTRMSPHIVRVVSIITAAPATDKYMQVSLTLELSPSMITKYLEAV